MPRKRLNSRRRRNAKKRAEIEQAMYEGSKEGESLDMLLKMGLPQTAKAVFFDQWAFAGSIAEARTTTHLAYVPAVPSPPLVMVTNATLSPALCHSSV
jgi:hypothetical protein